MITELERLLPPPGTPLELPPAGGWERIEQEFSLLPHDFKQYVTRYGTGFIGNGYITIFNPFAADRYLNLIQQSAIIRSAFQQLATQFPDRYNIPFFPNPEGYLPFGVNVDGAYLLWLTTGHPNEWTTAVISADSPRMQHFPTCMVDWLCNIISGRVRCIFFADDFLDDGVTFDNR